MIMKMKSYTSGLAGLASVALLGPALAIEKPAEADAPKEKQKAAIPADGLLKPADEQPAEKAAMLGVGGMAASEALSMHLGIEEGNGLTLYHIVPGSAAEKAGLKKHDVLTELDGKKISSQQDLRNAVLDRKPGDEVNVKYFSRGKLEEKKIVLGEREKVARQIPGQPGINPEWLKKNLGPDMPQIMPMNKEFLEQFENLQKELQMQGGEMQLDLGELLKKAGEAQPDGNMLKNMLKFDAQTSVTLMDNEGSITMNTVDGKKSVTVKDKDGKVQFDGPYDTKQDKAAVPEEIRERIERLGLNDAGNGMKLRIMPMGAIPPADGEEEDPAE